MRDGSDLLERKDNFDYHFCETLAENTISPENNLFVDVFKIDRSRFQSKFNTNSESTKVNFCLIRPVEKNTTKNFSFDQATSF
jgi:hypothetical protein